MLGNRGGSSCPDGSKEITSKLTCDNACAVLLGKSVQGAQKNGKECYKAGNGKCRQDGRQGNNAFLLCMKQGMISMHEYVNDNKE